MDIQNNNSINFNGKLVIRTYSQKGIAKIKQYYTSPEQDKLIQLTADSFTPRNYLSNYLETSEARTFKTLLEMIIKKPIKETNQRKIMGNTNTGVSFADAQPGRGGFLATLEYTEK